MNLSPLIPPAIVRTSGLMHGGRVTPPAQRVRVSPPAGEARGRPLRTRHATRRGAFGVLVAVAALVGALAWADAPDARGAAPQPTEGAELLLPLPPAPPASVIAPTRRALPAGSATDWLKVGWMKANPYPEVPRSEPQRRRINRKYRAARIGTLRKVDDPKPNPYR